MQIIQLAIISAYVYFNVLVKNHNNNKKDKKKQKKQKKPLSLKHKSLSL